MRNPFSRKPDPIPEPELPRHETLQAWRGQVQWTGRLARRRVGIPSTPRPDTRPQLGIAPGGHVMRVLSHPEVRRDRRLRRDFLKLIQAPRTDGRARLERSVRRRLVGHGVYAR